MLLRIGVLGKSTLLVLNVLSCADFFSSSSLLFSSQTAARMLQTLASVVNAYIGDAISDLLLVELVLVKRNWSLADWSLLYTDLPSRMTKVLVKDRSVIETANAERTCVKPAGLQEAIDKLVAQVPNGRSFVRPSGTEDVVRVYAEATTQEAADDLAREVGKAVSQLAGGV
jgi:phosphoacetylglucosamine mutase